MTYYTKNRDKMIAASKARYIKMKQLDKDFHKGVYLKHCYNITNVQYNNLLKKQNYRCAICEKHISEFNVRFAVDHNHKCCPKSKNSCGKCVRGLLCRTCNSFVVFTIENYGSLIEKAQQYLNNYR